MQIFTVTPNKQKAPLHIFLLLQGFEMLSLYWDRKTIDCKNTEALSKNLTLAPKHNLYLSQ